jgi:NADP-dependent 3-hydroxy acid dehydrogenase YdfG
MIIQDNRLPKTGAKPVIVITGASAGLGRALAIEAGYIGRVAILARREEELKKLQAEILSNAGEAISLQTDVRDAASVKNAIHQVVSLWNRIDILFNNAAVVEPVTPLIKSSDDDLFSALLTNVFGVYITTRECLKQMLTQKEGGTIINITSGAADRPYVGWSAYGSTKAAVNSFTKIVALEMENKPIRVAALSPGPFESKMQKILRDSKFSDFPKREKFINLQKTGKLPSANDLAKIFLDISLSDWPGLSGMVEDIRSQLFRRECYEQGINFPTNI